MLKRKLGQGIIAMLCAYNISSISTAAAGDPHLGAEISSAVINDNDANKHTIILTGSASWGIQAVTGRARIVIKRKQLKEIQKGDIVVAHDITSLWYEGLSQAGAIIIEKEDTHNHVLSLGKKLQIPVIVGAVDATKKIKDGEIITCDPITQNIYHVAFPPVEGPSLDTMQVLQREAQQSLSDKLNNLNGSSSDNLLEKADVIVVENDACILQPQQRPLAIAQQLSPHVERTKKIYKSQLSAFKKFILSEKSTFERTKRWVGMGGIESAARLIGYDELAVSCIGLGQPFIESSQNHILEKLEEVGESDYCMEQLALLIEACRKKPRCINYAAHCSYKQQVECTDLPHEVRKEDVIENPEHYKKIRHKLDQNQQENSSIMGYFARYLVKNKLLQ
jgi:phosphohistidine swiveling domain-containing protein